MPKNPFYFSPYNLTPKHLKAWGKQGGRPLKYVSPAERQKAYRRRKALLKLSTGKRTGILNLTTGRINRCRK